MQKINPKTPKEIEIMKECGHKLARVREALRAKVAVGVSAKEIDDLAEELIKKEGGESSFKTVRDYRWSTCVNVNDGVVHGIPYPHVIFKENDVLSVDVGMIYKGYHTDTSFSVYLGVDAEIKKFLEVGREALNAGIRMAKVGNRIYDISEAIEDVFISYDINPVESLVGHGIGRKLHEEPQIPCFVYGKRENSPIIPDGATFAIEVMYTRGSSEVYIDPNDKWTIFTKDGKIASLFEETVVAHADGPVILTK